MKKYQFSINREFYMLRIFLTAILLLFLIYTDSITVNDMNICEHKYFQTQNININDILSPNDASLHVDGHSIKNSNNKTVRLIGPVSTDFELVDNTWYSSNFDDWYNEQSFSTIKSWGCNTVRFSMTTNYFINNPNSINQYEKYIDLITAQKMYAIIEWGYCGNPLDVESYAASFFSKLSSKYANNPYILYEICNEPFDANWDTICKYSNHIIPIIRKNSPSSIILVGTPYKSEGQEDTPGSVINSPLKYKNIVYTLHCYAGQSLTYENLNLLKIFYDSNLAIDISEFGTTMSSGTDGHYQVPSIIYLKYLDKYNISWQFFNMSDIHFGNQTYDSSMCKPGLWSNNLPDDCLSESGLFIKQYITSKGALFNKTNYCMMMNRQNQYAFWSSYYTYQIHEIFITNNAPSYFENSWDISIDKSKSVMAYLQNNKLFIISDTNFVFAPENSDYLFSNFKNLKRISFDNMDFSHVISMKSIFRNCKSLVDISILNKNFSQLKDLTCAFSDCSQLKIINLSGCAMPNLVSFIRAFQNCTQLEVIYCSNFNPDKIKSYQKVFENSINSTGEIYVNDSSDYNFIHSLNKNIPIKIYN